MTRHVAWPGFPSPLILEVVELTVDGRPRNDLVSEDDERVGLCDLDQWTTATFTLRLTVDDELPEGLDSRALMASAVLRSDVGMTRIPARLDRADDGWVGHLSFRSDEIGGVAHLIAELVQCGETPAFRVVGESEPWTVPIDVAERPPRQGGSPLPSEWVDFGEPPEGLSFLVDYATAPVHVEMTVEPPRVYFNMALGKIQSILQNDSAQLERRRTRDLIAAQMAIHIVLILLRSGFDEIEYEQDGTLREPTSPTVSRAFAAVARSMPVDLQTFYEQVADARKNDASRTELWGQLSLAAMVTVGVGNDLERVTNEVFISG